MQGCYETARAFPEGEQLQSAFEVFEKRCRLYKAVCEEEVSENLKVVVVHKNLQDSELREHLKRSAATLDRFTSIKDEVINCSLAEAAAWGTAPMDVGQVNLVKGKGKNGNGKDKGEE